MPSENRIVASNDRKEMTVSEMASMGGKARAKKLSRKRRCEIARKGNEVRWKGHKK